MVDERNRELLERVLELTDTACQASLELLELYTSGDTEAARPLISDLKAVCQSVSSANEQLVSQLEHAYTTEMLENAEDTLEDIEQSIRADNIERAAMKMEFQLFPFLRQLREAFYFWGKVYPDKAATESYYRDEFAEHYRNPYISDGTKAPFKASVVIVAYNHLEMTKQCVESVLKYTDFEALNAELILVDHGSSDGTQEYFENLEVGRVIRYKANMAGVMFCALPQICNSEYYVHVANDTVVTKDWLNILLRCADSDSKIAMVTPATCNTSNLQYIHVSASDCDSIVRLAEKQNRSDPKRWNDRARILPPIGVFRVEALNKIGFWDPFFYTFDFMDDDFSLRARRAELRQILCEDVICYHRGSATVGNVQQQERTLETGRELFQKKHGVDPWSNGFCYDIKMLSAVTVERPAQNNILGIDCGFGDNVLQIRNILRRGGSDGTIYQLTSDKSYLPDIAAQSAEALFVDRDQLVFTLENCFPGIQFSYVCIGLELTYYSSPYRLLEVISRRMAPRGQLVFKFDNPYFAVQIHQMLQLAVPRASVLLLPPERVVINARQWFSNVELSASVQRIQGLDEFVERHYGTEFFQSKEKSRLEIDKYFVRCVL